MLIQLLCPTEGRCYVQLDDCRVPFQDERQARVYLDQLAQRLSAPHVLAEAQRRDAERRRSA